MTRPARIAICLAVSTLFVGPATAQRLQEPLRFFEGNTVGESTVNILFHKAYSSRTTGQGKINPDGSLDLVQRVEEDGRSPFQRRWHMKPSGPGRWSGTMSEAVGPVTAEQVGERFRFRFAMKDSIKVEQWLTPLAGGKVARNEATIRKHGFVVGHSKGTIRKLS
jgi:hypothetical protein